MSTKLESNGLGNVFQIQNSGSETRIDEESRLKIIHQDDTLWKQNYQNPLSDGPDGQ